MSDPHGRILELAEENQALRAEVERLRHNLETETGEHTKTVAELENVEWMLEQDRAQLAKANTRVAEPIKK